MDLPESAAVLAFGLMDEFDDEVGDSGSVGNGNRLGLIALLVAAAGILVGITGIVLANQAQVKGKALEARLSARPDRTPELEKTIADLDQRLVKLGSEFVKLGRQDRQLQENTQAGFDAVGKSIQGNREAVNQLTQRLSEMVDKLESARTSVRTSRTVAAESETASSGSSISSNNEPEEDSVAEGGIYYIKSGDTLSGIAKKFGVSLSQLQQANPTVNPRSLQIGQKILIPGQ